jgi:gluconolactonase
MTLLWICVETNGVRVHAPNGDQLAFLRTPEVVANFCFGGTKRNRLFMTGSTPTACCSPGA